MLIAESHEPVLEAGGQGSGWDWWIAQKRRSWLRTVTELPLRVSDGTLSKRQPRLEAGRVDCCFHPVTRSIESVGYDMDLALCLLKKKLPAPDQHAAGTLSRRMCCGPERHEECVWWGRRRHIARWRRESQMATSRKVDIVSCFSDSWVKINGSESERPHRERTLSFEKQAHRPNEATHQARRVLQTSFVSSSVPWCGKICTLKLNARYRLGTTYDRPHAELMVTEI